MIYDVRMAINDISDMHTRLDKCSILDQILSSEMVVTPFHDLGTQSLVEHEALVETWPNSTCMDRVIYGRGNIMNH